MKFQDIIFLYNQKKQKYGESAYKHISELLEEAKEIHKKDWLKNPTPNKDHEQSWRAFKGKNLENLIIYIIKDEVESLGLKIVDGNKLEGTNSSNLSKPSLETTTLWDYPKQSYGKKPKGNNKFQGVTPAFIIWNLLQRYTKEGDLVVDPMAGSGTTIDVCEEEGRKVIGYDINPQHPKVIYNDSRKIPLADNSVDMVFIDSPYGDNVNYSNEPNDIGKISAEDENFYIELEKVAKEIHRILKPGKVLAWLIGDQWVKRKFTPVGFRIYNMLSKYFEPIDIICVVRKNQSSNTGVWHYRAKKFNFFLRGFKYLIIVKKSDEKIKENSERKIKWNKYK